MTTTEQPAVRLQPPSSPTKAVRVPERHTPETEPTGSNPLRIVRLRLWLALFTMAILPVALSMAVLPVVLGGQSDVAVLVLGLMVGLTLIVAALTVWITRQILKPAEELVQSRAELHRLYEIARADSLRDSLTGLGNHRGFHEELSRQVEQYNRYHVPVALLLIDLDDLKTINDSQGHAAGDVLLREFGRFVRTVARYTDRTFRVGGDEFAILMPHTDADGALRMAERLQRHATNAAGGPFLFSAGISACPALATARGELYAQADAALYWSKRHGRASTTVFQPLRDSATGRESTPELRAAIARVIVGGLIRPVYQPIVDLVSGRVIGFEGLTRPSSESGFADPGSMFTAAEAVGRTMELDICCLRAVVAGSLAMRSDQLLTINVSPRTVEAAQFSAESLLAILTEHDISAGRVILEVTERETVNDVARLQSNLASLQQAGVRIAADDVGAGNAGLRLLSQFRFDIVKIDLSLVQEGAERDATRAVLRSLRDLAGRWGASVIAEGLETISQLQGVRELGITAGQGYLLGRPAPNPALSEIDIRAIETGGFMLESRHLPAERSWSQG